MQISKLAQPKAETGKKQHESGLVRRLALSLVVALALLAGLLALAAAICLKLDVAQEALPVVAIPLAGGAAFVAAFCNVRTVRRQGLLLGLLAAAALYLVVLVGALLATKSHLGMNAVILLLVMLCAGAAGGVFAANRSAAVKRHGAKRRHRTIK